MTRYLTRDRIAIVAALAVPLAVAAVLLPFRASWSNTNVALLLVVVVVGVAAIGNRVAGAVAAVWAALWFDFFFTVPYYRFTIRSSADVTTAVLLLLTGLAVSQLAARARRLKIITVTDAGYLTQIHETASLAKSATVPDVVVNHVREQLVGLLDLEGARFEYGSLLGHPPRLEPDGTVMMGRSRWDVELSGLTDGGSRAAYLRQRPVLRTVHAQGQAGLQAPAAGPAGRRHAGRSGRTRLQCQPGLAERVLTNQSGTPRRQAACLRVGWPGASQPRAPADSVRDSLPSYGSSHLFQQNCLSHAQCLNSPGSRSRSPVHQELKRL